MSDSNTICTRATTIITTRQTLISQAHQTD